MWGTPRAVFPILFDNYARSTLRYHVWTVLDGSVDGQIRIVSFYLDLYICTYISVQVLFITPLTKPVIYLIDRTLKDEEENRKYIASVRDGLSKLKKQVWDDMQRKVAIMLQASKIATFKVRYYILSISPRSSPSSIVCNLLPLSLLL